MTFVMSASLRQFRLSTKLHHDLLRFAFYIFSLSRHGSQLAAGLSVHHRNECYDYAN